MLSPNGMPSHRQYAMQVEGAGEGLVVGGGDDVVRVFQFVLRPAGHVDVGPGQEPRVFVEPTTVKVNTIGTGSTSRAARWAYGTSETMFLPRSRRRRPG